MKNFLFIFCLIITISLLCPKISYAVCAGDPPCSTYASETSCDDHTPPCYWDEGTSAGDATVSLNNPLTGRVGASDINALIGTAINAVLGLVGSIALVMVIYGGFVWMTAMGNKEAVTKGKDIIVWSVAGLAVIFLAYAVVNFILADVIGKMGTGSG